MLPYLNLLYSPHVIFIGTGLTSSPTREVTPVSSQFFEGTTPIISVEPRLNQTVSRPRYEQIRLGFVVYISERVLINYFYGNLKVS